MLKDLGIQAEILRCLEKGQKQMSIGDTNKSRPVTKVKNLFKNGINASCHLYNF